jgi:phosphate transport system substrate-binding protein
LNKKQLGKGLTLVTAAVLAVAVALTGCTGNGGTTSISMAGSTTVQPLAQALADEYVANVDTTVTISVAGGGSSAGVTAAGEGTADIGMASRAIKTEEFDTYPDLVVHHIASDGIAVVTDADTAVDVTCLTLEQTALIFGGNITNWAEVGGVNATITVIAREEGSGTRAAFEELVLEDFGAIITDDAELYPSNGAVRTRVAELPYSCGFISFGYLDETVDAFAMDAEEGDGCVDATVENALSGDYPVVRPLNLLTNGEPTGKVDEFITWILGTAGQAIVAESYIPVGPTS